MKVFFFSALILCLSVLCCGEDDTLSQWKEWSEFNEEIKKELCKPDKTDDKILDDMHSCILTIPGIDDDKIKEWQKHSEPLYQKCAAPYEGDITGFKKVDLTKDVHKRYLLGHCSENVTTCAIKAITEMKEKGEWKEPDESLKLKFTDEKKKELKDCLKKAVGIV